MQSKENKTKKNDDKASTQSPELKQPNNAEEKPIEKGGPKGPEPTRYGDWELGGKCVDF